MNLWCHLPLFHCCGRNNCLNNCLLRPFWWTPTVQWRQSHTPHREHTTRVMTWSQNTMTTNNGTPAMQVNPSEDLFCCTKKKNTEDGKNTTMKQNSQAVSMWMSRVQSSLFCVLLAFVLEHTKVVFLCALWLQARCLRVIFLANSLTEWDIMHLWESRVFYLRGGGCSTISVLCRFVFNTVLIHLLVIKGMVDSDVIFHWNAFYCHHWV